MQVLAKQRRRLARHREAARAAVHGLHATLPLYGIEIKIYLAKQRHVTVKQQGYVKGTPKSQTRELMVTLDVLRKECEEAAKIAADASGVVESGQAGIQKVLKLSRGLRGTCLNTTEEQEAMIDDTHQPLVLPLSIKSLDRIPVILSVIKESRIKFEIFGHALLKNPFSVSS